MEGAIIGYGCILGYGKDIHENLIAFLSNRGNKSIFNEMSEEFSLEEADIFELYEAMNKILEPTEWYVECSSARCDSHLLNSCWYLTCKIFNYSCHWPPHEGEGLKTLSLSNLYKICKEKQDSRNQIFQEIIQDLDIECGENWDKKPYIFALPNVE